MEEFLEVVEEYKIGNHNARLSTKVSAILFAVVISTKYITEEKYSAGKLEPTPHMTADDISKEFSISISTFKTFYADINKHKEEEHISSICKKYGITIPDKLPRKKKKN
jgi:hypothetical protein